MTHSPVVHPRLALVGAAFRAIAVRQPLPPFRRRYT